MDNPSNQNDLLDKIYQQLSRIAGALEILAQSGRRRSAGLADFFDQVLRVHGS